MLVYRTCSRNNRRLISKMKKLFTLLITAACFTASAQIEVEYPYNPDNQNDGHVGIEDILEILTVYGEEFTPEQLLVEGTSLTEWIQLLSETVIQQQAQIDSLSSLGPTSVEIDSSWINDSVLSNTLLRTRDWPLGFHGEVINHSFNDGSFVVPAGKALFITYTTGWVNLERGESYVTYVNPSYPAAADPYSQVIPIGPSTTVLGSSPSWWFSGVLIDTTGDFEVIYWEFSDGNYHVPEGKIFVPKWSNGEGGIKIQSLDNMWAPQIPEPHFHSVAIASQDVLSNEDTSGQMLGYLIDEDFFNTSTEQPSTDEPIDDNLGPCQGEFTVNYHGYDYELVEIGNQCWFAEDLVTQSFRDGSSIPDVDDQAYDATEPNGPVFAHCEIEGNGAYGLLYNWPAISDDRGLCPSGWHTSTKQEWESLIDFIQSNYLVTPRGALKSKTGWVSNGADHLNFNAKPSGFYGGGYCYSGWSPNTVGLWTTSELEGNGDMGTYRFKLNDPLEYSADCSGGFCVAVRCVKDTE